MEKLAEFVAKNGRNFEDVTRQRNPEDSSFRRASCRSHCLFSITSYRPVQSSIDGGGVVPGRFLYHKTSPEYLYYESRVRELEGGSKVASAPGPPLSQPHLRPPPAPVQQPSQPLPRVNRFSESKPDGERPASLDAILQLPTKSSLQSVCPAELLEDFVWTD